MRRELDSGLIDISRLVVRRSCINLDLLLVIGLASGTDLEARIIFYDTRRLSSISFLSGYIFYDTHKAPSVSKRLSISWPGSASWNFLR